MDKIKRIMSFLILCIGIRSLFVYLAKTVDPEKVKWASVPALALSIGFLVIYTFGLRKTGIETGGEPIWWNHLRPVHALFYLLFAVLAWLKNGYSYVPLLVDVIVGLGAFVHHHFL